jgi:hypothetical protein
MSITRTLCFSIPLLSALHGCAGKGSGVSTYAVSIRCQTGDGRPVPLVALSSERAAAGVITNMKGIATLVIDGREGEEVPLRVERLPADHTESSAGAEHKVVLKNVGKTGPQGIEVGYDLKLRRIKESYTVLVAAEQVSDLDVTGNGVKLARLNSRGAAAFRVEGKPGEELKVAILTEKNPRASVQDPTKVFVLPENGGVLTFLSNLSMAAVAEEPAAPAARRKRKQKQKPVDNEPKQIPFGQTLSAHSKKK